MSDLRCTRCGITRSYADAQIEDIREGCEVQRSADGRSYTTTVDHNWIETDD